MRIVVIHHPQLLLLCGRGWTENELMRVHTIDTKRWQVEIPCPDDTLQHYTVRQLKELLEDQYGLDADSQEMRFAGRALEDGESLLGCGVVSGGTVLLGLSLKEGGSKEAGIPSPGSTRIRNQTEGSLTMTVTSEAINSAKQEHDSLPALFQGVGTQLDERSSSSTATSVEEMRKQRLARLGGRA